ncbi:hypothetical protein T210_0135405 [Burkholderia pseudomallei MSHR6137]|nr:hypothetical protein T210_0135405 [Burkholderia pseudomallei MSHR6137]
MAIHSGEAKRIARMQARDVQTRAQRHRRSFAFAHPGGGTNRRRRRTHGIRTFTMRSTGRPRGRVRRGACIASAGCATFSWPALDDDESGSRSMRRAHAAAHRIERVDPHRADAARRA